MLNGRDQQDNLTTVCWAQLSPETNRWQSGSRTSAVKAPVQLHWFLVQTALTRRMTVSKWWVVLHATNLKSTFVYQKSLLPTKKRSLLIFSQGPIHVTCLEQQWSESGKCMAMVGVWLNSEGHLIWRCCLSCSHLSGGLAGRKCYLGLKMGKWSWWEWHLSKWFFGECCYCTVSPCVVCSQDRMELTHSPGRGREPCTTTSLRVGWRWTWGPALPALPGNHHPGPWLSHFHNGWKHQDSPEKDMSSACQGHPHAVLTYR